jgi:hypothetical protein
MSRTTMNRAVPGLNRPVVITGCQRSGTTLLHLILDSHPEIRSVDEDRYEDSRRDEYLGSPAYGPVVSFKLPRVAWNADFIRGFPDVRTIWCVRDPRDVVSSMLRLRLPLADGAEVSWAAHPHGAEYELHFALPRLSAGVSRFLDGRRRRFQRLRRTPPAERSREQQLLLAALCWQVKNELFFRNRAVLDMHLLRYERLVREPEATLREVLRAIGVEWDDRVLEHHRLHRGTSIGGTDNTRPIDAGNTGKWEGELSPREVATVVSVCEGTAAKFGYAL